MHAFAQVVALLRRNFLRHTDVIVLRQKHQQSPRNADLRGESGTLGANGVLEDLHHQGLPFKQLFFNRLWRDSGRASVHVGVAAGDAAHQIGHMQECSAVQANVNER